MFGFSIQKVLFTVAAIALVWYGFKWLGRVQARRNELAREQARRMREEAKSGVARGSAPEVEEMVECSTCGSFVAAQGAKNCGKPDCPHLG
ncbi:MAG: hypothetical protein VW268_09805 [Rhodospirillaceae bacterium]